MKHQSRKPLTLAILSISLLTVMAGAAIAPALGIIKNHFAESPDLLVQFIISMPALFIVLTNLLFPTLCRLLKTRTLALLGLAIYVVAGAAPSLIDNIVVILCFRALLGISVGMIMPLSTGLLAYYFPPERQASLMGLSAAMNQMGGVVATLLAGILAAMSWNYAFLVYLLAVFAIVLVVLFFPNEELVPKNTATSKPATNGLVARMKHFHPSVCGMFLCMSLFFVYPSNFAIVSGSKTTLNAQYITYIMVALDVVALCVGLCFGSLMHKCRVSMKYFAPVGFLLGYGVLYFFHGVGSLLIGSFFIGVANGVGIPYLNTIASIKGGHTAATTVMPLISASLYLGQFLSSIYISQIGRSLFGTLNAPYLVAMIVAVVYLAQTYLTRHFQSLPPAE